MNIFAALAGLFGGGTSKGPANAGKRVDIAKRFELRKQAGQGSMSKVHQAYDRDLGRVVCLKVMDKQKTADFEARFTGLKKPSEGEICSSLRHDNIMQTYDFGVTPRGEPFLVMEWIEGHGLNYLVETRSKVLAAKVFDISIQLCEGIDYLHGQRFLHRDICPRNAMVTTEGVVKLIDFGLTIPWKPEFCKPGNRTGSTDYLAPEVVKRMPTDNRCDLFMLGVTIYELFTGGLPWDRSGEPAEKFRRRLNTPGKDPREFRKDLPEGVVRFLKRSIERDRDLRYPTAAAMRDALRQLKAGGE